MFGKICARFCDWVDLPELTILRSENCSQSWVGETEIDLGSDSGAQKFEIWISEHKFEYNLLKF